MSALQLAVLAIVQGIAEFLPISSSAHLILLPALSGARDQGLEIDAALHVGTLAAVTLYFRAETMTLARGTLRLAQGRLSDPEARLALLLALATVPVVILGASIALAGFEDAMRSVELIAWTTVIFAVLLWAADRWGPARARFGDWRPSGALAMGLAQAVSLIPGVSRSGVCMTAARAMGYGRVEAARLSLVMSIPATMAVGAWTGVRILRAGDVAMGRDAALAAGMSFIAALLALALLMRMLRTWSLTPFVLYRLALGAWLMWVAYG